MPMQTMTLAEWRAKAVEQYGEDFANWEFLCVSCGHIQSIVKSDGKLNHNNVFFSCEGRYRDDVGCNWTLGGLFTVHEREVTADDGHAVPVFLFGFETSERNQKGKTQ